MARRTPEQEPQDDESKVDLFIAPYQEQYSEALDLAREAQLTTATAGWQSVYKRNCESHHALVNVNAEWIKNLCDRISETDSDEDTEKELAGYVKAIKEERLRFSAWRNRAVEPYSSAVSQCESVLGNLMRAASEAERENPLIDGGLVAAIQSRVADWPRAAWDEENGAVSVARGVLAS